METQLSKDKKKKISHIAIIMDGNGRWANLRGLPRFEGHAQGLKTLRKLLKDTKSLELDYLTIFSFSVDNWKRPEEETSRLMLLLKKFISNDLSNLHKNNVRIKVIGSKIGIPKDIVAPTHCRSIAQNSAGVAVPSCEGCDERCIYRGRRRLTDKCSITQLALVIPAH